MDFSTLFFWRNIWKKCSKPVFYQPNLFARSEVKNKSRQSDWLAKKIGKKKWDLIQLFAGDFFRQLISSILTTMQKYNICFFASHRANKFPHRKTGFSRVVLQTFWATCRHGSRRFCCYRRHFWRRCLNFDWLADFFYDRWQSWIRKLWLRGKHWMLSWRVPTNVPTI